MSRKSIYPRNGRIHFSRNHAHVIVARDFVITVTASLRILYVFVVMEIGSQKISHVNVTPHPALWADVAEAEESDSKRSRISTVALPPQTADRLDWPISVNERHVRRFAGEWMGHYNRGRPHLSLGPGIPDPLEGLPATQLGTRRISARFRAKKEACSRRTA